MGNNLSTQEKLVSHAKRGEYHQLRVRCLSQQQLLKQQATFAKEI
jgi:hypothetical protein